jgi:UDP-2,3-diacylglucosamine pyrophosphatase LpxH
MKKVSLLLITLFLSIASLAEGTHKNAIAVISDIHMSDARLTSINLNPIVQNRMNLVNFIDYLCNHNSELSTLVLNGDIFDEWKFPAEMKTYANAKGNSISHAQFLQAIEAENQTIFDALRRLKSTGVNIIYIPSNHDMAVDGHTLSDAFSDLLTYVGNNKGAGRYLPTADIDIEHGHIYDFMNAPMPQGLDLANSSIIAPGFFITKLNCQNRINGAADDADSGIDATTLFLVNTLVAGYMKSKQTTDIINDLYTFAWNRITATMRNVTPKTQPIATGVDRMTKTLAYSQYAVNETGKPGEIYAPMLTVEEWEKQCTANGVQLPLHFAESLGAGLVNSIIDSLAFEQMLDNAGSPARVVVFSHTHIPTFVSRESKAGKGLVAYVNTGTWSDGSTKGNTFAWIDITNDSYEVSLKEMTTDGSINVKNSASIPVTSTGIRIINAQTDIQTSPLFNIQGQRVNASYKGIIIKNGKKYILK